MKRSDKSHTKCHLGRFLIRRTLLLIPISLTSTIAQAQWSEPDPEPARISIESLSANPSGTRDPALPPVPAEDIKPEWLSSDCDPCQTEAEETLFDNLSLFIGLEGSKQPQDFGVNAHFGGRFSANWGIPLSKQLGIGLQVGTSINYTHNAVRVVQPVEGSRDRRQVFTTVGLFQRTDTGWVWGASYDFLWQESHDEFQLGQWRGVVGYEVTPKDEIGVWFALSGRQDTGSFAGIGVTLDPISQGSVYWRHTWEHQAETTVWVGVAEGHGETNAALGDLAAADERLVFGADIFIPLNSHIALFGQANFIAPADTGTVDAFLGFAFYPGGRTYGARKRRFAPVLPVANNTSFATDLSR